MRKLFALASIMLLSACFLKVNAQTADTKDSATSEIKYDEIIIRKKVNSNEKIVIEISGELVLVNGVPLNKSMLVKQDAIITSKKNLSASQKISSRTNFGTLKVMEAGHRNSFPPNF